MWRHFALALLCFTAAVTASERSPAKVRIYHERSTQAELIASVEALGKTHHLKLKRTLVPSVRMQELIVGVNGSVTIQEVGENETRSYYEDDKTGAFLFMNDENTLEGMVADSVALHYDDNEHTVSEMDEKTSMPFCDVGDHSKFQVDLPEDDENFRQQLKAPVSYVVEILAVADSILRNYKAQYFIDYMRVYWKMVDKRFRTVTGATIILRLTSIASCTTTACDAALMDAQHPQYSDLTITRTRFAQFMAQYKNSFSAFDIVHLITKRDLFIWEDGSRNTNYAGSVLAIGYPCHVTSSYAYNSGISDDDGLWRGTLTTAHEVAHNLGAYHDGHGTSTSCSWNWGYLMSYIRNSAKTFWFSSCSSAAMVNTYYKSWAGCLRTLDDPTYFSYPNYIAGIYRSLDTQCRWLTKVSNAIAEPTVSANAQCYRLKCRYNDGTTTWIMTSPFPALEGTPCAGGGYCKDGSCQASWV